MLEIVFEHPNFFRPACIGFSDDSRPLAVSFFSLCVYTAGLFQDELLAPQSAIVVLDTPTPVVSDTPVAAITYSFGAAGTVVPFLRDGWDPGEVDFTWTVAKAAQIDLPVPPAAHDLLLTLRAAPLIMGDCLRAQQVTLLLNGFTVGQLRMDRDTAVTVLLPRELVHGADMLSLRLIVPTAVSPQDLGGTDSRMLGLAVRGIELIVPPPFLSNPEKLRDDEVDGGIPLSVSSRFLRESIEDLPAAIERETGAPVPVLLRQFESLGNNCEFGIVQRRMGVEVLNLLRFGNAQFEELLAALRDEFRAATDPSAISVTLNDGSRREYVLSIPEYNIQWHTFVFEDMAAAEETRGAHAVKLNYLRRKFYEGLAGGRKIYVVKREVPLTIGQALPLLLLLNRKSRNVLLCVGPVQKGRQPGEVELLLPGLMCGHIGAFAPDDDVENVDPAAWLPIIGNAVLLEAGPNAAFRQQSVA